MINLVILGTLVLVLLVVWIFFIRNHQVYKFSIKILHEDVVQYRKLPSYETMVFKFWKPLDSFLDNKESKMTRVVFKEICKELERKNDE